MRNKRYELDKPVTVNFTVKEKNISAECEGTFKELIIDIFPIDNLGDDKVMTEMKAEYKLCTDSMKVKYFKK